MSVSPLVQIGEDQVDITKPCEVVVALRKVELVLTSGAGQRSVRLFDEEYQNHAPDIARLGKLIAKYEAECARLTPGAKPRRRAKSIRWT